MTLFLFVMIGCHWLLLCSLSRYSLIGYSLEIFPSSDSIGYPVSIETGDLETAVLTNYPAHVTESLYTPLHIWMYHFIA